MRRGGAGLRRDERTRGYGSASLQRLRDGVEPAPEHPGCSRRRAPPLAVRRRERGERGGRQPHRHLALLRRRRRGAAGLRHHRQRRRALRRGANPRRAGVRGHHRQRRRLAGDDRDHVQRLLAGLRGDPDRDAVGGRRHDHRDVEQQPLPVGHVHGDARSDGQHHQRSRRRDDLRREELQAQGPRGRRPARDGRPRRLEVGPDGQGRPLPPQARGRHLDGYAADGGAPLREALPGGRARRQRRGRRLRDLQRAVRREAHARRARTLLGDPAKCKRIDVQITRVLGSGWSREDRQVVPRGQEGPRRLHRPAAQRRVHAPVRLRVRQPAHPRHGRRRRTGCCRRRS